MKNVLIIIHSLESGGAQKSLISFLKCLDKLDKYKEYNIDLIIGNKGGFLRKEVPNNVNLIRNDLFCWISNPLKKLNLISDFSLKGFLAKINLIVYRKFNKEKNINSYFWKIWNKYIPKNSKKYDIAIAYMDGWCSHYVMDKVDSKKKILWVHNEYQKLGYDKDFDYKYYKNCDKIITISQKCVDSFLLTFPEFKNKIHILENISLKDEIQRLSFEKNDIEFLQSKSQIKLLSIGRLSSQKGFDIAVESAKILKEKNLDFLWLIIGKGEDEILLKNKIKEYGLENNFMLIGERKNPYSYIKDCDIFLQTSRYEGKSIVLDEAKILEKPIIVTNYKTVRDSIEDKKTGMIVELNPLKIAQTIENLINNKDEMLKLSLNLNKQNLGNEREIKRYLNIMFEEKGNDM